VELDWKIFQVSQYSNFGENSREKGPLVVVGSGWSKAQ